MLTLIISLGRSTVYDKSLSCGSSWLTPNCMDTATTPFTAHGANDNGPCSEEPREGKALTRGLVVGAESVMAPPTIT